MKKQSLTLCVTILIALETIGFLSPFCFLFYNQLHDYEKGSGYSVERGGNIFDVDSVLGRVFATLVIIFLIISFISFFLTLIKKNNILTKICYYTPIISMVFLVISTIYTCSFTEFINTGRVTHSIHWEPYWLFYILVSFHIITIVLSLLIKSGKNVEVIDHLKMERASNSKTNDFEQIKELKALLDSGVITQEEFDAKKKQLLGL